MAREDVDLLLRRMMATFEPPERLKLIPDPGMNYDEWKGQVLEPYHQALERFDAKTLELTWHYIRDHKSWISWPPVAVFVKTATSIQIRNGELSPDAKLLDRARELADAYVGRWLDPKSKRTERKLFERAQDERWAGVLLQYVTAAAFVQAQLITPS